MIAPCTPVFSDHVVGDLVSYADCQAHALGAWGYVNLASSPMLATLLFVLLSIAIALFGVRMMAGRMPTLGDSLSATAAVGIVLTLLFSWPAVRILIYETVLDGPQIIAGTIMRTENVERSLVARIGNADRGVQGLILSGTGREELASLNTRSGVPASNEFHSQGVSDDLAFASGRYLLLASAVGSLGGLQLLGGLLIALLPLFSLLILFRSTAQHFVTALSALAALTIAGVATSIVLMAQLAYLEGWLASTLEARAASFAIASAPIELLLITSLFAGLQVMAIVLSFRLCLRAGQRVSIVVEAPASSAHTSFGARADHQVRARPASLALSREHRLVASLARNPTIAQSYSASAPSALPLVSRANEGVTSAHARQRANPRATRTAQKRDRQ